MTTPKEKNVEQTRQELIDERLWVTLAGARDLATLIEKSDLTDVDIWDLRAQLQSVQTLLIDAAKPLDRALTQETGDRHRRRGEYVIMVATSVKEGETYRGGNSETLRHDVAERIVRNLCGEGAEDITPEIQLGQDVADEMIKVWSQPPKSKLPSKKQLKALGIDPDDYLISETVAKNKVDVWPVAMYESIIGEAPEFDTTSLEERTTVDATKDPF